MKFTSVLLASAVFALSAQASAFDLMHPFWGPSQNQLASDTNYSFTRYNGKHITNQYVNQLSEKLLYGITDNWTVFGAIGRNWSKSNTSRYHNKSDSWSLGTSYNIINNGKHFLQAAFDYMQSKHHDRGTGKTVNYYDITGTYGYNFDSVTPYAKVNYKNYSNTSTEKDARYELIDVTVAAYKKLADKVGADLGVKYTHQISNDYAKGQYDLIADVSYQFTDKVALKAFANYMLDQKHKKDFGLRNGVQSQYTVGADLKVVF